MLLTIPLLGTCQNFLSSFMLSTLGRLKVTILTLSHSPRHHHTQRPRPTEPWRWDERPIKAQNLCVRVISREEPFKNLFATFHSAISNQPAFQASPAAERDWPFQATPLQEHPKWVRPPSLSSRTLWPVALPPPSPKRLLPPSKESNSCFR